MDVDERIEAALAGDDCAGVGTLVRALYGGEEVGDRGGIAVDPPPALRRARRRSPRK